MANDNNSKFVEHYKEIVRKKLLEDEQANFAQETAKRKLRNAAAEAQRYEKDGTVERQGKRVDLATVVEEDARDLKAEGAAAYNDWRQGMNRMWKACMVLAKYMDFVYGELAIKGVERVSKKIDKYKHIQRNKCIMSMSDPDLPELQYTVSLEDGKSLQASFEKGEGLSDQQLKALFIAEIETWLETRGYSKNAEGKHINADGAELSKDAFDKLKADTSNKGLAVWIKDRYKGLTINPAPENTTPSPSR